MSSGNKAVIGTDWFLDEKSEKHFSFSLEMWVFFFFCSLSYRVFERKKNRLSMEFSVFSPFIPPNKSWIFLIQSKTPDLIEFLSPNNNKSACFPLSNLKKYWHLTETKGNVNRSLFRFEFLSPRNMAQYGWLEFPVVGKFYNWNCRGVVVKIWPVSGSRRVSSDRNMNRLLRSRSEVFTTSYPKISFIHSSKAISPLGGAPTPIQELRHVASTPSI